MNSLLNYLGAGALIGVVAYILRLRYLARKQLESQRMNEVNDVISQVEKAVNAESLDSLIDHANKRNRTDIQ